jgi:hypothetical protein
VTLPSKNKFDPQFPITDKTGKPTQAFAQYLAKLDALVAALAGSNTPPLANIGASGSLVANDAAAAGLLVPVGGLYRDSVGVVHMRTA